jgi:hypothetical protein
MCCNDPDMYSLISALKGDLQDGFNVYNLPWHINLIALNLGIFVNF